MSALMQTALSVPRLFLAFASALLRPARLWAKPVHLQIEPTTFCNLACPQCPREEYVTRPVHMEFTLFTQIINFVKPRALTLSGLGEPTLNPNLLRMIRHAITSGAHVNTTSNFTHVSHDQIEALAGSGLDLLNISVDAATTDTYAKIRVGGDFSLVIDNIRYLAECRARPRSRRPRVRLCFVVQESNVAEMSAFYEMAAELGCDEVLYQVFGSFGGGRRNLVAGFDLDAFRKQIRRIEGKEHRKGRPRSNVRALKRKYTAVRSIYCHEASSKYRSCIMPWISAYISAEGEVRPCCRFASRRFAWGSIGINTELRAVLNDDRWSAFRRVLKSSHAPDVLCAECLPDSLVDVVVNR